jgi:hypothetical protein
MSLEYLSKVPADLPRSLPVFRLAPPDPAHAAPARLSRLAQALGLEGRAHATSVAEDWALHLEGLWELGLHSASGALVARHREKYQRPAERPFELDDARATALARRFVERTALVPLDEVRPRAVTHLRTAGGDVAGGPREERVLDAGVALGRAVRDVDVDGPGAIAMINVDPEGEVVGLRAVWRPVVDVVDEVRILSPDVADRAMEEIAARVRGDVVVTRAGFGYFEQGVMDAQAFLQPAFTLVYEVRDGDVAFRSAEVVAASEKRFEPLRGEKRFPQRPQRTRRRTARR